MKHIILALCLSFVAMSASAANIRVQKVKTLGVMKHKVIFQSTDLKKVRGSKLLKGKIVAQWGTEVFEVATGLYACNKNNYCKLSDYETNATYRKCVINKEKKVQCRGRLGSSSYGNSSGDVISYENPDEVYDEYNRDRHHYDEVNEFPARVSGEFDDIHF